MDAKMGPGGVRRRPTREQLAQLVGQIRVNYAMVSSRLAEFAGSVELDAPRQLVMESTLTSLHEANEALSRCEAALGLTNEYVDQVIKPGVG